MVDILNKVSPEMMRQAQEEDVNISKTMHYVKSGKKPTLAQLEKLNQEQYTGTSHNCISWFVARGLHEIYENRGLSTTNFCYQRNIGPKSL